VCECPLRETVSGNLQEFLPLLGVNRWMENKQRRENRGKENRGRENRGRERERTDGGRTERERRLLYNCRLLYRCRLLYNCRLLPFLPHFFLGLTLALPLPSRDAPHPHLMLDETCNELHLFHGTNSAGLAGRGKIFVRHSASPLLCVSLCLSFGSYQFRVCSYQGSDSH